MGLFGKGVRVAPADPVAHRDTPASSTPRVTSSGIAAESVHGNTLRPHRALSPIHTTGCEADEIDAVRRLPVTTENVDKRAIRAARKKPHGVVTDDEDGMVIQPHRHGSHRLRPMHSHKDHNANTPLQPHTSGIDPDASLDSPGGHVLPLPPGMVDASLLAETHPGSVDGQWTNTLPSQPPHGKVAMRRTILDTDDTDSTPLLPQRRTSSDTTAPSLDAGLDGLDNVAFMLLDSLVISPGILDPLFRSDGLLYTLCVPADATEVMVIPGVASPSVPAMTPTRMPLSTSTTVRYVWSTLNATTASTPELKTLGEVESTRHCGESQVIPLHPDLAILKVALYVTDNVISPGIATPYDLTVVRVPPPTLRFLSLRTRHTGEKNELVDPGAADREQSTAAMSQQPAVCVPLGPPPPVSPEERAAKVPFKSSTGQFYTVLGHDAATHGGLPLTGTGEVVSVLSRDDAHNGTYTGWWVVQCETPHEPRVGNAAHTAMGWVPAMCLRPLVAHESGSGTEAYQDGTTTPVPASADSDASPSNSALSDLRRSSIIGELVLQDSGPPQQGRNLRQCSVVDDIDEGAVSQTLEDADMIETLRTFALEDLNRLELAFGTKSATAAATEPMSSDPPPRHLGVHFPYFCLVLAATLTLAFIVSSAVHGFVPLKVNPLGGTSWHGLRSSGACWPPDVYNGHVYKLVTALFIPVGGFQLLFDLAILKSIIVAHVERVYGLTTTMCTFVVGGVVGHLSSAAVVPLWLTTGPGPGITALLLLLLTEMLLSMVLQNPDVPNGSHTVTFDLLLLLAALALKLVIAALPGGSLWANFGGAVIGFSVALGVSRQLRLERHGRSKARFGRAIGAAVAVAYTLAIVVAYAIEGDYDGNGGVSPASASRCTACAEACIDAYDWCSPYKLNRPM
eukprot:m.531394 g.531394  ORF g.531394 m.531394 type:complete len:908 (+) comp22033_c0_seq2:212-2935(+)